MRKVCNDEWQTARLRWDLLLTFGILLLLRLVLSHPSLLIKPRLARVSKRQPKHYCI
eukprot:COSAG03_NODE_3317_length_2085_cov_22.860806_3_plen_56_part_01